MKERIKELFGKKGQNRYMGVLALICILGIGLLLIPDGQTQTKQEQETDAAAYRKETEEQLSKMLSCVQGVGHAEVMILFENEGRIHYAADGEESRDGEKEQYTESFVLKNSGSGVQTPLIEQKSLPKAAGVFVIAQGAENAEVQLMIREAVHAVLGVPSHRIEVLTKK